MYLDLVILCLGHYYLLHLFSQFRMICKLVVGENIHNGRMLQMGSHVESYMLKSLESLKVVIRGLAGLAMALPAAEGAYSAHVRVASDLVIVTVLHALHAVPLPASSLFFNSQ